MSGMTKAHAITIFGSIPKLAASIGITRQAIYQWPDILDQRLTDEINGAALRLGLIKPEQIAA